MTSFFAVRGSRDLSADEFKAHIALAIRLENVGVLLGAGASKGAGGKIMCEVWEALKIDYPDSAKWLEENKFVDKAIELPNIENILDLLDIAEANAKRAKDEASLKALAPHRTNLRRAVLKAAILQTENWEKPASALDNDKLRNHVRLLSRLVSNRQPGQAAPWIYTTNYDLAIEWAAESLGLHLVNGFSGLHARTFSPSCFDLGFRNTNTRGEARFGTYNAYLGKIHGSLSWQQFEDGTVVELPARAQWTAIKEYLDGKSDTWPGVLIFPGAAKFVQTTGFIYGEMIRRLTEFLSRSNTCLIVSGYAFNDEHLNRVLLSALQNPTLQLIIYLPELDKLELFPTLPKPDKPQKPNPALERLIKRQLPQVTVVGFGAEAYFDAMTKHLPEPALLDDAAQRARAIEGLIRGPTNQPVANDKAQDAGGANK